MRRSTGRETMRTSGFDGVRYACPVLLTLAGLVFAAVFLDYGITWDESVQATYGELVLDYFASWGRDARCNEYSNLYYYGPLFESIVAAVYRAVGGWKYEIRHAAIGLTALLTLAAAWRFGRRVDPSGWAPLFAILALLMMPRFIGHAFNNSKDVPFACGFAWAMVAIARLLSRGWRWPDVLLCGAGIGLALALRIGALMLLALLAAGVAGSLSLSAEQRRDWRRGLADRAAKSVVIVSLAWAVMVLAWPWTHAGPLTRPLIALAEMSDFGFSYPTLFAGEIVDSDRLPRHYVLSYLAIVTPLPVLALAALGLAAGVRRLATRRRDSRDLPVLLVPLWCLLPLGYFLLARPNVYDGIRHFLFVLPALALLCGSGAAWLVRRLRPGRRWLVAVPLLVVLATPLREQVLLHPYQSSYFNALVGGVERAWRSYETDYWASSYREAMRWILDEAPPAPDEETVILVACNSVNRACAEYYLERSAADGVSMECVWWGNERLPAEARYYVAMLRYGKAATFFPDWPIVHRIGRRGAVFSVIKRNPRLGSTGITNTGR